MEPIREVLQPVLLDQSLGSGVTDRDWLSALGAKPCGVPADGEGASTLEDLTGSVDGFHVASRQMDRFHFLMDGSTAGPFPPARNAGIAFLKSNWSRCCTYRWVVAIVEWPSSFDTAMRFRQ